MEPCERDCELSRHKMCRNEQNTVLHIKVELLKLVMRKNITTAREIMGELFGLFDRMPILDGQVETRERCSGCNYPNCKRIGRYKKVLTMLSGGGGRVTHEQIVHISNALQCNGL